MEAVGAFDYEETVAALQRVFGVVGICPVVKIPNQDIEGLQKEVLSYMHQMYENATKSFKVHTRRVNKRYALNSMEVSAAIGEKILQEFPGLRVDVHEPELI